MERRPPGRIAESASSASKLICHLKQAVVEVVEKSRNRLPVLQEFAYRVIKVDDQKRNPWN